MKILCVFGQYQYGKKERGINTEYFSFIPALEALGHEVVFFDSWDKTHYSNFIELNQKLIQIVDQEKPDVVVSVQFLYEIWTETWDFIRANFTCKTINWCTDDSWKYKEHSRYFAPHFDLMVTTYEEFLPRYKAQSVNVLLSSWAVPVQWLLQPKKADDCRYAVTFVGSAHGDRKEKIQKLKAMGIDVECFGFGWEHGAVKAEEIPDIFNNSIISLNFANSSGENQIKARVFEVTGCGGFLLTENAKNLNTFFNEDEIALYNGIEDCARQIQYYLSNSQQRDTMVFKSFEKVANTHTYAERFKLILDAIQTIEKKTIDTVINYNQVIAKHHKTGLLKMFKRVLVLIGQIFYGKEKGKRFARRLVYELSWRWCKEDTYKSKSIVGRMFYDE